MDKRRSILSLTAVGALAVGAIVPGIALGSTSSSVTPKSVTTIRKPEVLANTVNELVAGAKNLGALATTKQIHLMLPLRVADQAAMTKAVYAEYAKGSPTYHQFLSPTEFGNEFGAAENEVNLVTNVLQKAGLKVSTATPGHLYVDATASVAQAEKLFDVKIDKFSSAKTLIGSSGFPTTHSSFFANVSNISLPSTLRGLVTGVIGLDDASRIANNLELPTAAAAKVETKQIAQRTSRPQAAIVGQDGGATPCPQATAGDGYVAPQLATAYNFNGLYSQGYLGQGMHAALLELDSYHDSNIAAVQSCYGLNTKIIRHSTAAGSGGTPHAGETEVMADVTTILEMLPKLGTLDMYVAPNTVLGESDIFGSFVADDKDQVISSSWGGCEESNSAADDNVYSAITEEAAAQGQNILQAAGDSGAVDCRGLDAPNGTSISAMQEASVPWVTGVGGTDLGEETANGVSLAHDEDSWNDDGAGGGGVSTLWPMPPWQAKLKSAVDAPGHKGGTLCGASNGQLCREVPDIAADADNGEGMQGDTKLQFTNGDVGSSGYSIYCGTSNCDLNDALGVPLPVATGEADGWYPIGIGGTSLATPLTASALVLWDEMAKAKGITSKGVGLITPTLYSIAGNATKYAADFNDITTDSNDAQYDVLDCPTGCNPKGLYKAAKGYDMASGLGSYDATTLGADVVKDANYLTLAPSTVRMFGYVKGVTTTQKVLVASGAKRVKYKAKSSSKWLKVSKGTATGTLKWHVSPKGLKPGIRYGMIHLKAGGKTTSLRVVYQVTKKAKMKLSAKTLHFHERIVSTSDDSTASVCDSNYYNDELFDKAVGASGLNSQTGLGPTSTPVDKSTLRTLKIKNVGPKGSVLHWTALPQSLTSFWLGTDIDKGKQQNQPMRKQVIPTSGSDSVGKSSSLPLASTANSNSYGGYAKMNQGTYHGIITVRDLADPKLTKRVKVIMTLGSGKHTPTVGATKKSYSVSVVKGKTATFTVDLSDAKNSCDYGYSIGSNSKSVVGNSAEDSGTMPATGAAAATGTDTGDGQGIVTFTVNAKTLKVGKHNLKLIVQSYNAEPNPLKIPLHITVKK